MTKAQTLRIWTADNGSDARLTIPLDGSRVSVYGGGRTEEGYHYSATTYTIEEGILYADCGWDSQDCDGRVSGGQTLVCPLNHTAGRPSVPLNEWGYPDWTTRDQMQRDYSAEAMGY